jgi:hypothetical protein
MACKEVPPFCAYCVILVHPEGFVTNSVTVLLLSYVYVCYMPLTHFVTLFSVHTFDDLIMGLSNNAVKHHPSLPKRGVRESMVYWISCGPLAFF